MGMVVCSWRPCRLALAVLHVVALRRIGFVDPKGLVEKIPDGCYQTRNRRIYLKLGSDLEYVLGIIE